MTLTVKGWAAKWISPYLLCVWHVHWNVLSNGGEGKPEAIRCDNGPEYISHTLKAWAELRKIRIEYIQRGNPQQNTYIERYNRTVRYEWFAQYLFESVAQVQVFADQWLWIYNHERPMWPLTESPPPKIG